MTYRIRRGEDDLGTASLEELLRSREDGALTGGELVQAEGSSDWVMLESLLRPDEPPPLPPLLGSATLPPIIAQPKGRRRIFTILVLVIAGVALAGSALLVRRTLQPGIDPTDSPPPKVPKGMVAASIPIVRAETPTVADVQKRARLFGLRQWLEGYQQRSVRLPKADAANEQFIRVFIDKADDGPEAGSPLKLDEDSLRIGQDTGETDPLILTLAAVYTVNWYRRDELYRRAFAQFPASAHRAYPALFAAVSLMNDSKYDYDQEGELNTSALTLLAKCFKDGSFRPGDQQEIAAIFVDQWGVTFFNRNSKDICATVHAAGADYAWLSLVLDGQAAIADAWAERGTGFSDSVSGQGREFFKRDLATARRSLTQAWKLRPDYPIAACLGISASLDVGIDESRRWFDRAVAAQIDQPDAWANMRWALRPRWYGSTQAELAFGQMAVNTGRFDTDVPRKLFDCVTDLEEETSHAAGSRLFGRHDIWPELQRMYDGYVTAPSQAKLRSGWRASFAIVAYLAGHYDVAAKQLQEINWTLPDASLTSWGVDLSAMSIEVAARTGPLSKEIAAAEVARGSGNRAEAMRRFSALAALKTSDDRTREFIAFRRTQLTEEQHLEDGRWIPLVPAHDHDKDWIYRFGEAHRTPKGDLDVEYGNKGHMLYPKIIIGPDFEVRGSFEVVRSTNTNFQGGIVIGHPDLDGDIDGNRWWASG
jgi:hypothetical protein